MDKLLLDKLKECKKTLLKEDGFEIVGVFGSVARDEETVQSDLDLVYRIKPKFLEKYGGFQAFHQLNIIRNRLQEILGREVDLATMDNHSRTFQKYALKDIVRV